MGGARFPHFDLFYYNSEKVFALGSNKLLSLAIGCAEDSLAFSLQAQEIPEAKIHAFLCLRGHYSLDFRLRLLNAVAEGTALRLTGRVAVPLALPGDHPMPPLAVWLPPQAPFVPLSAAPSQMGAHGHLAGRGY